MDRRVIAVAIAVALVSSAPASSDPASNPAAEGPDALIIQAKDHAELSSKFCAANPNIEHIIVLPASLFVDSQQVICDSGPYKLYRIIEHDDTDDFEYFLDPPMYGKAESVGLRWKSRADHADDRSELPAIEVILGPARSGEHQGLAHVRIRSQSAQGAQAHGPARRCRPGPRYPADPVRARGRVLPPASSISARAKIGAGTSPSRWPRRR